MVGILLDASRSPLNLPSPHATRVTSLVHNKYSFFAYLAESCTEQEPCMFWWSMYMPTRSGNVLRCNETDRLLVFRSLGSVWRADDKNLIGDTGDQWCRSNTIVVNKLFMRNYWPQQEKYKYSNNSSHINEK